MNKKIIVPLLAVIALGAGAAWYFNKHGNSSSDSLQLYGNVDIRQVQLAFNSAERIDQMLVNEGEHVSKGQLLAKLDTSMLQQKVLKAEADVEAARLAAANAANSYQRTRSLVEKHFVPQQQADDARTAADAAEARYKSGKAELAVMHKSLADTALYAPNNGVIQERILEPGDMASPQRPVYTLALTDPIWVRAYVQGTDLGKLKPGMRAEVSTDSFPGKRYRAWIGYISPSAEFTPKSVETSEVRTSLVYQVRVFVCNSNDELRLGMPATVNINLNQPAPGSTDAEHCGNVEAAQP